MKTYKQFKDFIYQQKYYAVSWSAIRQDAIKAGFNRQLLKPGFVATDGDGVWTWYRLKPDADTFYGQWLPARVGRGESMELYGFDIASFEGDWKDSLMECGK